ncbi:endoplasmin-like [Schistocerca cancellata]|uniref:endoplasmin-like n=1 Tax=Schistocerca cancellata TaxID=274614 RepID=UPI002119AABE|nr:endoplasmin-like [Schistocerca cancellata]
MRIVVLFVFLFLVHEIRANDESHVQLDLDIGASREALRTDDEVIKREEEAIKTDGLNVSQVKQMKEAVQKFTFQAEVSRMMKLIINSLYRNKEIFLRELISNASDALDKIRLLSLTDDSALSATNELVIRIKIDQDDRIIHITDTGIGMTRKDLINNLGTIAKSGTSDFFGRMQNSSFTKEEMSDLIGQFGVGFYSSFLVADKVVVKSKHNDDKQYIWESDAGSFSIAVDPDGDSLKRGTTVSLHLKEDAYEYTDRETVKKLVQKYSQFINFPIYLWHQKTVEEKVIETPMKETKTTEDDLGVEEEVQENEAITVKKLVDDWELLNVDKPIWTRKPSEVQNEEYYEFYKALTRDTKNPLAKMHFAVEGDVAFKAVLFIPQEQPEEILKNYGKWTDNIKFYVRRVFITDEFKDMLPDYIQFVKGVVDSDDLPLNVSRETLQQHKLIKVIQRKLIRKALDMMLQLEKEDYMKFWKEYSTNIKLGVLEDSINRAKLAKLLMFHSSYSNNMTTLSEYVERAKPNQDQIYYIAGATLEDLQTSPLVEGLLRRGYEVLYMIEAVDEYCINKLPEFGMKRFQNIAKEDFIMPIAEDDNVDWEKITEEYEPLIHWLERDALKEKIQRAKISQRLMESPCALVASVFGYTGNMERLAVSTAHRKSYQNDNRSKIKTKKIMEINPHHELIRELHRRFEYQPGDETVKQMAIMLYRLAALKSGYMLDDTFAFSQEVENMMVKLLGTGEFKEDSGRIKTGSTENEDIHEEL